ncbi:MAG TPA: hypothetical protein H9716_07510 [Candidatus Enterocloster faecavium]|uniref:6-bladed beta-propeller n=1 Tax=Candidatus Enterocloster faecavium TaxID=2838560 RepID=A0A9D2L848_9FIRM|nr:hypothetical protein [Candidatus Enterocloster faecavium]
MIYGYGDYRYELVKDWGKNLPKEWGLNSVPGIYVDSKDHVYIMSRSKPPIIVCTTEGEVLDTWGDDILVRPHGMYIDEDNKIYIVDGEVHVAYVFNEDKEILMTLGVKGQKSDTGAIKKNFYTVKHSAGPFNYPTHLTKARNGYLFATDGYGNARVHRFKPDGTLDFSWGEPGHGPGEFMLPHCVVIDDQDRLLVADRHNNRIQLFTMDGEFIEEWTNMVRPAGLCIKDGILYVGECKQTLTFDDSPSRISIFNLKGELLSRLENPDALDTIDKTSIMPDELYRCVHSISVDSEGSIYVTEVGQKHPADYLAIRKYRRVKGD